MITGLKYAYIYARNNGFSFRISLMNNRILLRPDSRFVHGTFSTLVISRVGHFVRRPGLWPDIDNPQTNAALTLNLTPILYQSSPQLCHNLEGNSGFQTEGYPYKNLPISCVFHAREAKTSGCLFVCGHAMKFFFINDLTFSNFQSFSMSIFFSNP